MFRRRLSIVLWLSLLLAGLFAAWMWLRPYDGNPDPAARCRIVAAEVSRDRSYYWLHIHLEVDSGSSHDLAKPVRLRTADGVAHQPADSTFGAIDGRDPRELWFKFWLEEKDLQGPLTLHLNDGSLVVKSDRGFPGLESGDKRNFTTHRW